MKVPKALQQEPVVLLGLGIIAVLVVYYVAKNAIGGAVAAGGAVVNAAGGVLSGNNALTTGTPYQGAGVLGTAGAAANSVSGGLFQSIGDWIGGTAADIFQPSAVTAASAQGVNRSQVVTPNNISDISDAIGGPDYSVPNADDDSWSD
jgi:hypothetical protein